MVATETLPPIGHAAAGSAGAMFALSLIYPLDIIKTRIQVQTKSNTNDQYTSVLDGLKQILQTEGLSGLYAGLGSSLIGTASTNFTYFYCYSLLRDQYNRRYHPLGGTLSTSLELVLGAAAGVLTTLITTPIALITTRQQTLPAHERQSMIETALTILKDEGIGGLWRGIKPSLVLCINPAITYGSFEKIRQIVVGPLSPGLNFLIGAVAKTLATVVTYPYIMAKVRLQWRPSKELEGKVVAYKGSWDVLKRVVQQEGLMGCYKGMSTQITKAVLSQALLFMMKDIFTHYTLLAFIFIKAAQKSKSN